MAEAQQKSVKKQLSISEYLKVKEKRAQDKLKLRLPKLVFGFIIVAALYLIATVTYFLINIRHLPEH